jgi:signal transduction histidine kinase/CheY-like chemotaxis protein/HPt (histidine-containing phosphotransfer) domain-containing protein
VTADPISESKLRRGGLARKYALFTGFAISLALAFNGLVGIFFAFEDQRALVARVQQEQAQSASQRIGAFVGDIMRQLDWLSVGPGNAGSSEDLRLEGLRLLRHAPAILDLRLVAADGRERLMLSRIAPDRIGSGEDRSQDASFRNAAAQGSFYGEVEFRRGSEPYLRLGKRMANPADGVVLATLNLTFIRDLVTRLKVGQAGRAYIVERSGRLIAHPDLRFVLRNTNLAGLLREAEAGDAVLRGSLSTRDIEGRQVLSVLTPVPELGWRVVIDLPQSEAYAPIVASIQRSLLVLAAALLIAVLTSILLSRRLVAPVRALTEGAARIGEGRLDERIAIRTGDELQELGDQFNLMAGRLEESRNRLEDKVSERTAALASALDQASSGQRAAESARRVAEEATLAKSRFLAVVGHDIRTPLSGVLGVLEILDRRRLTQRDRKLLDMASTSGETLINLANATLDLSRLEAGTESLEIRDYEPAALLTATAALMRPAAERKDLVLRVDTGSLAGRRLSGDASKINRIVLNLLRNAISFTDAGTIDLRAGFEAGEGAGTLVISVADTGIGIEPAMQGRIFQDFVQVDPETGRRAGGVGLGLAICSKLVALMGGTLQLASTVGQGSIFTVRLPAPAATATGRPAAAPSQERPLTVLVVDDEPVTREVSRIMVGRNGHKAVTAASGEAAVALLARKTVDVVLLDMHMTGMDGLETARAIRALPTIAQPAIVILTADVSPETMRRLRQAGLSTVVPKPATSAALRQALARSPRRGTRVAGVRLDAKAAIDEEFLADQSRLIGQPRMAKLVALFASVSATLAGDLERALAVSDRPGLERAAHQLASSASALGLGQVVGAAAAVEADAAQAPMAQLGQAVAELIRLREQALAALAARKPVAVVREPTEAQELRSAKIPSL